MNTRPTRSSAPYKYRKTEAYARLYVAQRGCCSTCRRFFPTLEIDHVVPLAAGGADVPANWQLLCGRCNRRKGTTVRIGSQATIFDRPTPRRPLGRVPYGLHRDRAGALTVLDGYGPVLRHAFEASARGVAVPSIGAHLTNHAPPQRYLDGFVHHTRWTGPRVIRLLKNRAYVEAGAVTPELFEKAAAARALTRGFRDPERARASHPLAGLVQCSCGKRMTVKRHEQARLPYFYCSQRAAHGGRGRMIRVDDVERLLGLPAGTDLRAAVLEKAPITLRDTAFSVCRQHL